MNLPIYQDYINKVVVITGGGGVLCSTIVKSLALQGAKIALLDLNLSSAQKVVAEIRAKGGTAIAIQTNVLDLNSLKESRNEIRKSLGKCDILINGAGGNHSKATTSKKHFFYEDIQHSDELHTFFDLEPEGIQFVFNLNFMGTLLPSQVFSEDMINRKGCSIVNISSMNAFTPLTKIPAYSAAKAAISNFTQWLAVYFAKVDIRVNALAPGFFLTEQNRKLLMDNNNYTDRAKTILDHTPMSRFGNPEDLTGTVLWLCSENSCFITGVIIPIDGGFSSFSGV